MGDTTLLNFVGVLTSRLDGDSGGTRSVRSRSENLSGLSKKKQKNELRLTVLDGRPGWLAIQT